jgi:hypothetical protein
MTLFGGARNFFVNQLIADLAEADAYLASPDSQLDPAWLAKLAPMLGKATSFQLGELVSTMPLGSGQTPAFNYQATLYPKPESGRRLGELAVELARYDQATGIRTGVGRLVAGEGDGRLLVSHFLDSLTEIKQSVERLRPAAAYSSEVSSDAPLSVGPPGTSRLGASSRLEALS